MTARGVEFLQKWIANNVTDTMKQSVDGDAASLSIELAEQAIVDAGKAGFSLEDLEPELGAPEVLIREALESDDGTPGD
jgi:hypothetical protein